MDDRRSSEASPGRVAETIERADDDFARALRLIVTAERCRLAALQHRGRTAEILRGVAIKRADEAMRLVVRG